MEEEGQGCKITTMIQFCITIQMLNDQEMKVSTNLASIPESGSCIVCPMNALLVHKHQFSLTG